MKELLLQRARLVEKIILAGTAGRGGEGLEKVTPVIFVDMGHAFIKKAIEFSNK